MTIFSLENERPEIKPPFFAWLHKGTLVLIWWFVFHNPFPMASSVKEICYYFSAVFFLVLILSRKITVRFNTPLAIPFALYTGWACIGIFFALDKPDSLHDLGAHLLKNIWLYYMLCYYFGSRARLVALGWTIVIAAFIFSAVSLSYFYFYQGYGLTTRFGIGFPNSAINVIGFTTVFAFLLAYHFLQSERRLPARAFLITALGVNLLASVLTQSRGTLLAIGICFFILSKNKKLYTGVLACLVLFIVMSPMRQVIGNVNHYFDRLYPIFFSIEIIKDYPITGTGFSLDALKNHDLIDPDIYEKRLPDAVKDPQNIMPYSMVFILPHSMLFNIPVRTGLVGLALYLVILFVFAREARRLYIKGNDDFIRSWALLCMAAMAMHVTKGLVEPVDTAMVEVILYSIFAMLTITGFLDMEAAVQPTDRKIKSAGENALQPNLKRVGRGSRP